MQSTVFEHMIRFTFSKDHLNSIMKNWLEVTRLRERESNCCPKSQDLTMVYFETHRFKNSLGSRIYKAKRSIRYEGRGIWKRSLLLVFSNFKITHLISFSYFLLSISVMLDFSFKLSFIFLIIFLLDKWNYTTTTYIE